MHSTTPNAILESQRKYWLDRLEELNNRAIRDLRLFSECAEDQLDRLFNKSVWLFRHVIRYAIDIRSDDEKALVASILQLNQSLKAQKIRCHIERESNVYFVVSGTYTPKNAK
jgi:predicted nucleotidyltransferase